MTTKPQSTTEAPTLHPVGLEILVNCAECGSILNAEICHHDERPFSKGILITVERCKCENVSKF